MPFMPAPKTFLFRILLLLILPSAYAAGPSEDVGVYQFGEWTLITPTKIEVDELVPGPHVLRLPVSGMEFLLYWHDGKERALAVRFDGENLKDDVTVLRSRYTTDRLKGCTPHFGGRIKSLKKARPAKVEAVEFPDDGAIVITGSERGFIRHGETLAFDLGTHRVQITQDSPIVRVGEWGSADFCRFELKDKDGDE